MGPFAAHKVISKNVAKFSGALTRKSKWDTGCGSASRFGRVSLRARRELQAVLKAAKGDGLVAKTPRAQQTQQMVTTLEQLEKRIACLGDALVNALAANENDSELLVKLQGEVVALQAELGEREQQLQMLIDLSDAVDDTVQLQRQISSAERARDVLLQQMGNEDMELETMLQEKLQVSSSRQNEVGVSLSAGDVSGAVSLLNDVEDSTVGGGWTVTLPRMPSSLPFVPPSDTTTHWTAPQPQQDVFEPVPGLTLNLPWYVMGEGGPASVGAGQTLVLESEVEGGQLDSWLQHPMAPGLVMMLGLSSTKDAVARFWSSFSSAIPSAYLPASSLLLTATMAYMLHNMM